MEQERKKERDSTGQGRTGTGKDNSRQDRTDKVEGMGQREGAKRDRSGQDLAGWDRKKVQYFTSLNHEERTRQAGHA